MQSNGLSPIGIWTPHATQPAFSAQDLLWAIHRVREPVHIVQDVTSGCIGLGLAGEIHPLDRGLASGFLQLGALPAMYPEWLGDRSFLEVHSARFPYVGGAMYQGIASTDMVIALAKAGMLGFFGAAGLTLDDLEHSLIKIRTSLENSGLPWGSNLIYMPQEPMLEEAIVDLYLRYGVQRVSAAAFMALSANIVRYAATGLQTDSEGRILRKNHVFAKLSHPDVAKLFLSPAPKKILSRLVSQGKLTQTEATLASRVPIAEDITCEADSGGHTDNRPLLVLLPTILALRDKIASEHKYTRPIRIGAAGGLGTPSSVAAAFSAGAAYVLTGSINQSAIESGLSPEGRALLAMADLSDVTMAPAADMFEMGVKVQVLKRGTMFSNRAAQLYAIYSENESLENIPNSVKAQLEKDVFHTSLEEVWKDTRNFFAARNPEEIPRAEQDPKHLMALVFKWYLGNAAKWAIEGDPARRVDYQICCGPSMGAFNTWVKDSFLEKPENRNVADIALNLLEGAAVITRAQQARSYGVSVPGAAFNFRPRPLSQSLAT
ncbi:MAG: PfaD family polyunsaturated fatty acid/polyketide biosynthesis protein [Proteobacteria bacterium]|nr:PfaD family polyunsaturated fatty acid/polyketide biosynthesis protein [Pseudomonadota bacterium]